MKRTSPFICFIIIAVGLFFIGNYLFKEKVDSISDLQEINGTVLNYSFVENRGLRNHTFNYRIYLNEYSNSFQVIADFAPIFNKESFEYSVKQGDNLKILIAKNDFNKIGQNEIIRVFGIEDRTTEFLNPISAIKEYNGKTVLIFGFIFLAVGIVLLYLNPSKRKKSKTTCKTNHAIIKF